jgi:uncharacterized protein YgbK (DUF1537 family)
MEDHKKSILIIADDLTGANDTGVQYKKNGFSTVVKVLSNSGDEESYFDKYDVIAINADTRALSSQEAYKEAYRLTKKLENMNIDYIYKKVDSLMRGNPAPELEAVMDAVGSHIAIVAPSFPDNKRIIQNGILSLSENNQVDVTRIFNEETQRKAFNIKLQDVRAGAPCLRTVIEEKQTEGYEIFVIDALTDDDLLAIRDVSEQLKGKKVLCGSAGFAKQLSSKETSPSKTILKKEDKITMIVVGSRSKETAEQVKKVASLYDAPIVLVDADEIRDGDYRKAVNESEKNVMGTIERGKKLVIVAITSLFEEFSVSLRNTEDENIKSLRIAKCLGMIVKDIYEKVNLCNVVSTGGDTSLQICNALETAHIELEDEITAGIPIGKIVGGIADQMTIITKSGGFGDEDALVRVIEYLNIERSPINEQLSS